MGWKLDLARFMSAVGVHLTGYVNNCFVCDAYRQGRSDEEIDTTMRAVKVIAMLTFFFAFGCLDDLQFKYRIVD